MEVLAVLKHNHLGVCLVFRKHRAGPGGGLYGTETQPLNEFAWSLENTEQGQVVVLTVLKHNHLIVCLDFRKHLAGPGGGPYSTETQTLNEFVWCLENT